MSRKASRKTGVKAKSTQRRRSVRRKAQPSVLLPDLTSTRLWLAVGLLGVLLAAIVSTGLGIVTNAQETRQLYHQLGATQQQQDALLADHSRLLLERAALSSLQNIEQVAQNELEMEFPEQVGQVLR
ncbi:MAG: cell division protein FtsL [Pseudomonadota bacterium]